MTKTFKASVSQRFIELSDQFFDATLRTILQELLQNSRRAGATEVTVALADGAGGGRYMCYEDNGCGAEDPAVFLALSETGWGEETKDAEQPAGIGFFALSAFDTVEIESRDWSAVLDKAAFTGRRTVTTDPIVTRAGIRIHARAAKGDWEELRFNRYADIILACSFCPVEKITVTYNGRNVVSQAGLRQFIKPEEGVMVPGHNVRMLVTPELPGGLGKTSGFYAGDGGIIANFHGVLMVHSSRLSELAGFFRNFCAVYVLLDVLDARTIRPVLPARQKIRQDAALEEVVDFASVQFVEWHKNAKSGHSMPFEMYKSWLAKIPDLPQSEPRLAGYVLDDNGSSVRIQRSWKSSFSSADGVIRARVPAGFPDVLWLAGLNSEDAFWASWVSDEVKLMHASASQEGYDWYDSLPILQKAELLIGSEIVACADHDGCRWLEGFGEAGIHPTTETICARVTLEFPDKSTADYLCGLDVVAVPEGDCWDAEMVQTDADSAVRHHAVFIQKLRRTPSNCASAASVVARLALDEAKMRSDADDESYFDVEFQTLTLRIVEACFGGEQNLRTALDMMLNATSTPSIVTNRDVAYTLRKERGRQMPVIDITAEEQEENQ